MKTADLYNRRIGELVDVYRGAVPLSKCLIEAVRMQASSPELRIYRDEVGEIMIDITFADSSTVTFGVDEEM